MDFGLLAYFYLIFLARFHKKNNAKPLNETYKITRHHKSRCKLFGTKL